MGRPRKGEVSLHPSSETEKAAYRALYRKHKLKAMQLVSELEVPKCVHCGCDLIDILEFNHLHTTHMERGGDHNRNLASNIFTGKITDLSDLEIACRVCNALDFIKKKFSVNRHTIIWK